MICFHHNDQDGRCSGAIVNLFHKLEDKRFVEWSYEMEFPIEKVRMREQVYFVDIGLKDGEILDQLLRRNCEIIWIDHHGTSAQTDKEYGDRVKGIRNLKPKDEAGCELTWRYFSDHPAPLAVQYIGDRDKWAWKLKEKSSPFCEGLEQYDQDPRSVIWKMLLVSGSPLVEVIVDQGEVCLRYRERTCRDYVKSYGYEVEFEGHHCFACGFYKYGSEKYGTLIDSYDVVISHEWTGEKWVVGLYSKEIDVSKIATKFGGGGHPGASGFTVDELPFKKVKNGGEAPIQDREEGDQGKSE